MTITIEQLRVRVGLDIADSSRDADIIVAQEISNDLIENYLDRWLTQAQYTEQVTHQCKMVVSLKAYPILSIYSITDDTNNGASRDYHYHIENGLLYFDAPCCEHQVTIVYTGGYGLTRPMPPALELAILLTFDRVWGTINSQSDGVGIGSGVIKSVSSDGAKVDFDVSASGSGANAYDMSTGVPESVIGILNMFRRLWC